MLNKQGFKDKWEDAKRIYRKRLYNRRDARKLMGFQGNGKSFTEWMQNYYFMSSDDLPDGSLIRRGLMDYRLKTIYAKPEYDEWGGYSNDPTEPIKYINVPLFTHDGINFFKMLINDKQQLKKESEQIRIQNIQDLNLNYYAY